MRVLYDHQILYYQKFGGISRYFYELITGLREAYPDDVFKIKAAVSQNYYFRNIIPQRELMRHGNAFLNDMAMRYELFKSVLAGQKIDILHPTYYEPFYLPDRIRIRTVITVHDMTHERYIREDQGTILRKRKMLERSDAIIAISEFTKKDMLEIYPGLSEKKIKVIYHGNSLHAVSEENGISELYGDYVLFVGQRSGYKDFSTVLKVFSGLSEKYKDLRLLCVGGGRFGEEENREISGLKLTDRVLQVSLSDEELAAAYQGALCFVYPSKYEGFGIPILEAFSQSCPVVLRNASCFPEIAGDAGLYFDSEEELAQKIITVLDDSSVREDLKVKGKQRCSTFSWDRTVKDTYGFYKEVI